MNLKDLGVHTISITFAGGGDDGSIEEVELFDYLENDICSDVLYEPHQVCNGATKRYHLRSDIDELFYNLIDDCSQWEGDWVNNDGGYGDMRINLETNEYDLTINFRTTRECCWDNQAFI